VVSSYESALSIAYCEGYDPENVAQCALAHPMKDILSRVKDESGPDRDKQNDFWFSLDRSTDYGERERKWYHYAGLRHREIDGKHGRQKEVTYVEWRING
jgi:hypothetical protein